MGTLKHEIETATPPPYGSSLRSIHEFATTESVPHRLLEKYPTLPLLERSTSKPHTIHYWNSLISFFFISKKAVHSWLTHGIAHLWDVPGHFHLSEPALLRMVSVRRRNLPEHIMVDAQRNCLDEKQAFPEPESQPYLHHHRHHGPAILDTGDNSQFVSVLMVPSRSKRPRQYSISSKITHYLNLAFPFRLVSHLYSLGSRVITAYTLIISTISSNIHDLMKPSSEILGGSTHVVPSSGTSSDDTSSASSSFAVYHRDSPSYSWQ